MPFLSVTVWVRYMEPFCDLIAFKLNVRCGWSLEFTTAFANRVTGNMHPEKVTYIAVVQKKSTCMACVGQVRFKEWLEMEMLKMTKSQSTNKWATRCWFSHGLKVERNRKAMIYNTSDTAERLAVCLLWVTRALLLGDLSKIQSFLNTA